MRYFGNLVDNGELLGIYRDSEVSLFRVETGELERKYEFPEREKGHPCVAVSPVGRCIALAYGNKIYVDDWAKGTNVAVLDFHNAPITAMTFSGDGKLLATGDGMGTVNLWKVASITAPAGTDASNPALGS